MKTERPILFSGAMVRAILDGRKTMTRRVVNLTRDEELAWDDSVGVVVAMSDESSRGIKCPHGQPGDKLWVKETFSPMPHLNAKAYFRATDPLVGVSKWKPSIFMPRWASRITLEITAVRVERLQEISEADAKAEGVGLPPKGDCCSCAASNADFACDHGEHRRAFCLLWDSINSKRRFGWDVNPWVWVISFKRIKP